ncbi:MAG: hypothetical protein P4L50_00270 [Anaerolineaceae bacterium]|nr:hypothetical protein [Anaerolineaceae bacterium]
MFKKPLLAFVAGLALIGAASAQVNVVPQVGVNTANLRQNTYSAAILSLIPEATAGTDFFCISGSATKNIHVHRLEISGTGTAATQVVHLNHNLGLDTGTAAVVGTYGPVANPLKSTDPAATATVVAYNATSGNPTIGGTVTVIRTAELGVVASTVGIPASPMVMTFGTIGGFYDQSLDIPSGATTEQYCLNFNGATVTASVLQGYIEWTED